MVSYIRFVLAYRWWFLAAVLAITGLAATVMTGARAGTSLESMFLGESPQYAAYKARAARFGGDGYIVVALDEPELLAPETLGRFRRAVADIEALPDVESVQSLLDAGRIAGDGSRLQVDSYVDLLTESPGDGGTIRKALLEDEFVRGLVLSTDGRHTALVAQLVFDESRAVEDDPAIIADVLAQLEKHGFSREKVHLAGLIPIFSEVIDQTFFNLQQLTPIVLLVLLLVVWAMFRRLWPVVITATVGAISVIWTMGFAVAVDPNLNILTAMVPAVLLIVSFSDVIHLCSAYLLELAAGEEKNDAILKSGADVGKACLYTSMTTFVGFISLSLIPAPVFRLLGLTLGLGVGVALLLAMTLSPILFSLMRRPKAWRVGTTARVQDLLDRALNLCYRFSTRHSHLVVVVFAVVLVVSLYGISRITIDTDFAGRLDEDNSVQVSQRYFEEHFEGTATAEIYVHAASPEGVLDPDLFAATARLEAALEARPGVDRVISLVDVMRQVHRELGHPEDPDALPDSRALLAQYMLLLEMSPDSFDLSRLVDFERRTLRLLVRLPEQGVRQVQELGDWAVEEADDVRAAGGMVEATGSLYLMGAWLGEILEGQELGLIFAFFSIALMMVLGLRSWRNGLWSMLPNVLPLLVLGGVVGLTSDAVDSDAIAIAMIAIGIGVDDTIHFLMRLRIESARTTVPEEALANTFHFSGRAIVITTVVLVLGFAPFALSDYLSLVMMGTLLPMCLVVALLADLLLVPALATLGVIHIQRGNPGGER
jgi:predicted RND superfamily exporter protein